MFRRLVGALRRGTGLGLEVATVGAASAGRKAGPEALPGSLRPALQKQVHGSLSTLSGLSVAAGLVGQLLLPFVDARFIPLLAAIVGGSLLVIADADSVTIVLGFAVLSQLAAFFPDRAAADVNERHGRGRGEVAGLIVAAENVAYAVLTVAFGITIAVAGASVALRALGVLMLIVALVAPTVIPAQRRRLRLRDYGRHFARALDDAGYQAFQLVNSFTKSAVYAIQLVVVLVLAAKTSADAAAAIVFLVEPISQVAGVGALVAWRASTKDGERHPVVYRYGPDAVLGCAAALLALAGAVPGLGGAALCVLVAFIVQSARIANNAATQRRVATGEDERLAAQKALDGAWRAVAGVWPSIAIVVVGPRGEEAISAASAAAFGVLVAVSVGLAAVGRRWLAWVERGPEGRSLVALIRAAASRPEVVGLAAALGALAVRALPLVSLPLLGALAAGLAARRRRDATGDLPALGAPVFEGRHVTAWPDLAVVDVEAMASPGRVRAAVAAAVGELRTAAHGPGPAIWAVPLATAICPPASDARVVGPELRRLIAAAAGGHTRSAPRTTAVPATASVHTPSAPRPTAVPATAYLHVRQVALTERAGVTTATVMIRPRGAATLDALRERAASLARLFAGAAATPDAPPIGRVVLALEVAVGKADGDPAILDLGLSGERTPFERATAIGNALGTVWRAAANGKLPDRLHVEAASADASANGGASPPAELVQGAAESMARIGGAHPSAPPLIEEGRCVIEVTLSRPRACAVTAQALADAIPALGSVTVVWRL